MDQGHIARAFEGMRTHPDAAATFEALAEAVESEQVRFLDSGPSIRAERPRGDRLQERASLSRSV
ncbi:hypothetical protein OHB04_32870 [Streptomyces sp. NBC_01775]|uniref:hypothetical protein n=1 Tax=Streptomyces sp. NBC_01775 TaxID=2975939 RepID=UPI002DDA0F77|nr:hypothetical protein [Streptomyces sp. NBC_01775]WSB80048.1 hypothetical protein OHB04_32870 [Streptomyces sp. NBC_01775]